MKLRLPGNIITVIMCTQKILFISWINVKNRTRTEKPTAQELETRQDLKKTISDINLVPSVTDDN